MTTNLKAIYEQGVLRLSESLPLPDGAQVDVIVISQEEDNGDRSPGMGDPSWEALTQLLGECSIDTGVPDRANQHDHYLYGIPKDVDRMRNVEIDAMTRFRNSGPSYAKRY